MQNKETQQEVVFFKKCNKKINTNSGNDPRIKKTRNKRERLKYQKEHIYITKKNENVKKRINKGTIFSDKKKATKIRDISRYEYQQPFTFCFHHIKR